MEKKQKTKFKKFIAVLCVFVLLQSYFSSFAQVVWAISEEITGEELLSPSEEESILSSEEENAGPNADQNEESQEEAISGEETPSNEEQPIQSEGGSSEEAVIDEENTEQPVQEQNGEDVIGEENSQEESTEPVEENPEKPLENVQDEPIEPYVEPEVTMEVASENTSIYKGYLYANATSDLRYATNYNTIDVVTIVGGKNMTSLTIQDEPDKMQLVTNEKIGLINEMYYRQTRISVDEFNKILGEDGSITLYTPEGEVVGYINKDSDVVNNEYVFIYSTQLNSVKFELTNIKADGTISIKNDKSIKETSIFSRNQISIFSAINTISQANAYVGETVKTASAEGNINLEETESRMIIDVDTDTLMVEHNNEVAINVTLKTDEERYDLFENPTIDLEFPSAVEDVEVTGVTLLYKNGLSIGNWEVVTNTIGRKVLKISLTGSQLEYTPGTVQEGTTIVIYTNINVNRLTADTSESLRMTYTNKDTMRKTYSLEGRDSEEVAINFVGRQELVRSMSVSGESIETVTSYDETTEKTQIKTNEEQTAIISSSIVNNYEATLNDVVIVGRIPFVGNKDGNGNDLGTNFDAVLQTAIATNGVIADVYYSEDGMAEASSESWSQDTTDMSKYKSYKIVVREKTLAKGERLNFEYNLTIPSTVGNNAKGYANYVVYYKIDTQNYSSQCSVGMFTEEKEIDMEDINDENKEEVAVLTVGTQVSQGGTILGETDSVFERQILRYTIVVRNTSNVVANNVVIRANAENANLYDWEYITKENYGGKDQYTAKIKKEFKPEEREYAEFTIEALGAGETRTFEYEVIVKDLIEIENPEVYGKIKVMAVNVEETTINTFKNSINEAELEVMFENDSTESLDGTELLSKNFINLVSKIRNISDSKLDSITYTVILPESLSIYNNSINITNNDDDTKIDYKVEKGTENSTKITFTITNIDVNEIITIYYTAKTEGFEYTKASQKITAISYAETKNNKYYSNDFTRKVYQNDTKLEYDWNSDNQNEYLDDGEEVKFSLLIKNIGFIDSKSVSIEELIPNGLEVLDINVYDEDENDFVSYQNPTTMSLNIKVEANSEKRIEIVTKVNSDLFERDQDKIEFGLNVNYESEEYKTDVISYKIKNENVTKYSTPEVITQPENVQPENAQPETPSQNNTNNNNNNNNNQDNSQPSENVGQEVVNKITYYISGFAWIDSNQDGIRQSEEIPKEAVVATLYRANINGGLDTSAVISTTSTDTYGKYVFSNIEAGKYIVVFDYNSSKYKVTKYQVDTATSTEDSDAISKNVTINGESRVLGVTDVLEINASSLISVDIGLVDKTNFDLSLEKEIESVKVKNDEGTKVYEFNNSNARLDIRSKYYKSSVLDITYKFKVKNEGDVSGYVNKIVDYLPEGIAVNLNASPDWYIGSDDGLYYTGLVDQEIAPGETKVFTLVLRKTLENGEAAKLVNGAEIVESTNAQGLFDRDSIENNKMKSEDDYGEATLTISIATGNTGTYIATILIIIIMVAVIVMIGIKIKNTKKVYR